MARIFVFGTRVAKADDKIFDLTRRFGFRRKRIMKQ